MKKQQFPTKEAETEIREINLNGFSYRAVCDPRNNASYHTHVDEKEIKEKYWKIRQDDVVIDIGGAAGSYTCLSLAMGAKHVVSFCPSEKDWTTEAFLANLKENEWEGRVTYIEEGLWSENGFLTMYPDAKFADFSHSKIYSPYGIEFPVKTLDYICEKIQIPMGNNYWIKMDAEGAEVEILKGSIETIRKMKPKILIEIHRHKDEKMAEKVDNFMTNLGYQRTFFSENESHAMYEV